MKYTLSGEGVDYKIGLSKGLEYTNKYGGKSYLDLPNETPILYLRMNRVVGKYREHFRRQNNHVGLEKSSLLHHLKHSSPFIGTKKSHRFKGGKNTSCYLFFHDKTGIELRGDTES